MDIKSKLDRFAKHGVAGGYSIMQPYNPFPISPQDYLEFANADLQESTTIHSRVNAISNIKRSIDCRVDAILDFWGLRKSSAIIEFLDKLKLLEKAGVITPTLLTKINLYRNRTEHKYEIPAAERVKDFYDVATLFLGYTDKFLRAEMDSEIIFEDNDEEYGGGFELNRSNAEIKIELPGSKPIIISSSDMDNYLFAIKLWYRALDR